LSCWKIRECWKITKNFPGYCQLGATPHAKIFVAWGWNPYHSGIIGGRSLDASARTAFKSFSQY
jgi:hypothetical protein